jgi:hypothetical protein
VHRSRQIEKKLRNVEASPVDEGVTLLTEVQTSDVENEEPDQI